MKDGARMNSKKTTFYEMVYNDSTTKKVGIMGGTFDPIHLGHLFIAETALYNLGLNKILFIPTGNPPHKDNRDITSQHHRLIMTALAINDNEKYELSDMEISRKGKSYTIDTIKQLQQQNKNTELFFITGTDAFMEMESWKKYTYIFNTINIVVVTRLGYDNRSFHEKISYFKERYNAKIIDMAAPILEISSSDIRERVRQRKSIKYLVTDGVEKYISKHQLYVKK